MSCPLHWRVEMSCAGIGCFWRQESYRYFGNGESFVMKIHPEFKVFRWTHENNLFVLANPDHLAFGGQFRDVSRWFLHSPVSVFTRVCFCVPTTQAGGHLPCISMRILSGARQGTAPRTATKCWHPRKRSSAWRLKCGASCERGQ
jgi:hypothetical protein